MRQPALAIAAALGTLLAACSPTGSPTEGNDGWTGRTDGWKAPPPSDPAPAPPASADALRSLSAAPVAASCGTPVVDGVISPGEWDAAVSVRFGSPRPESAGGGEVPATFQAMTDGENLFIAVRMGQPTLEFDQSYVVELDADNSGWVSQGDDVLVFSRWWYPWSGESDTLFADDYRWDCVVEGAPAVCGPRDDEVLEGFPAPGTIDGGGAIGLDATSTVVEMWHPYRGGDPRDIQAEPGDVLPLGLFVRLLDRCPDYPRCYGDTAFPAAGGYRDLVIGCGPPPDETVVAVRIDVKPCGEDEIPTIHLSSHGSTPVALLGSADFPVAGVDLQTAHFAGAPVERAQDGSPHASVQDSNRDGFDDSVLHFETSALQLEPGLVEATLAGRTLDGHAFRGTDVVRVRL